MRQCAFSSCLSRASDDRNASLLTRRPAAIGVETVDLAFDIKQWVNPANRFQGKRRDWRRRLAGRPSSGARLDVGQHEELATGMAPARGFQDRPGTSAGLVQSAVSAIGVGLQNAGEGREMAFGMFAAAIPRIVEHRRRRRLAAKGPVVADVSPASRGIGLALGEDRNGRVVAMHAFGGKDMRLQASSPSLASRDPPQQAQTEGDGTTTRSRGKWSGKGLRAGCLRTKPVTCVIPALAAARSAARSSSLAEASSSSSCNSI